MDEAELVAGLRDLAYERDCELRVDDLGNRWRASFTLYTGLGAPPEGIGELTAEATDKRQALEALLAEAEASR